MSVATPLRTPAKVVICLLSLELETLDKMGGQLACGGLSLDRMIAERGQFRSASYCDWGPRLCTYLAELVARFRAIYESRMA